MKEQRMKFVFDITQTNDKSNIVAFLRPFFNKFILKLKKKSDKDSCLGNMTHHNYITGLWKYFESPQIL